MTQLLVEQQWKLQYSMHAEEWNRFCWSSFISQLYIWLKRNRERDIVVALRTTIYRQLGGENEGIVKSLAQKLRATLRQEARYVELEQQRPADWRLQLASYSSK